MEKRILVSLMYDNDNTPSRLVLHLRYDEEKRPEYFVLMKQSFQLPFATISTIEKKFVINGSYQKCLEKSIDVFLDYFSRWQKVYKLSDSDKQIQAIQWDEHHIFNY